VEVRAGTPAADAGLRGGDVVVHVDATRIRTTEELEEALLLPRAKTLGIVREGKSLRLAIPR
jgi:S1-C subfamily serine protease